MNNNNNITISSTSIMDLPYDVLTQVFSYLDPKEVLKFERVCKRWWKAIQNEQLWKKFAGNRKLSKEKVSKRGAVKNLKGEEALKTGKIKPIELLSILQGEGEYNKILGSLKLKNEKFIKIERDIQVLQKKETGWAAIQILEGHSEVISFIVHLKRKLISGSNNEILIWEKNEKGFWTEGQRIEIRGQNSTFLQGSSNSLICVVNESIFVLKDLHTLSILREVDGFWGEVDTISFDNDQFDIHAGDSKLIMVGASKKIKMINTSNWSREIMTDEGMYSSDYILVDDFLISCSLEKTLKIWKQENGHWNICQKLPLETKLSNLCYKDGFLFGANNEGDIIKVWRQNEVGLWTELLTNENPLNKN